MSHLDQYISYLRNLNGAVTTDDFDDDWAPIGPNVRAQLKDAGLAVEFCGLIGLTPPSNMSGEIGEPS